MLDIEDITINFRDAADPTLEIVDARIISTHGDEGLMEPYGVTDMRITITYRQSESV
jgi:hypothetical protein